MVSKFQISRRKTAEIDKNINNYSSHKTRQNAKRTRMGFNQIAKRSFSLSSTHRNLRDVVIASAVRTPMGSFRG